MIQSKKLKNILYVEDDDSIAQITQMILEDIGGFKVNHFYRGKDSINWIKKHKAELIIMDVMMPEMDGIETVKKIHKIPEAKETPVIFMTAKSHDEDIKKYKKLGALGVIPKPFDPSKLCEEIQNFWQKKH